MLSDKSKLRISYIFLCATPFVAFGAVLARPLRIPGVYHVIGAVLFVAISTAAWTLGARAIRSDAQSRRQLALAGTLLAAPFAVIALLWVGLSGPWAATAAENQMRYLVLILMAIFTTAGLVMLREALSEAGERFYSTLGFTAMIMAGSTYIVWDAFMSGAYATLEPGGEFAPVIKALGSMQNILLFVAAALTYSATAAFACSLASIDWLGRKATLAYTIVSVLALTITTITIAEIANSAADPNFAAAPPWYVIPGLLLCIPALPLIMPALLGAVLLRRAGNEAAL